MTEPIRLITADDHPLIRKAVCSVIDSDEGVELVGEAKNGDEAHKLCKQFCPDVLLLDIDMPSPTTIETIKSISESCKGTKFLILSAYDDYGHINKVIGAGISGYILKDELPEVIVKAIYAVHKGSVWFSQAISNKVMEWQFSKPQLAQIKLSKRELDLLRLIAKGCNNTLIARELNLSGQTVRNYISTLYDKLSLHTRAEVVIWARENGF